ncbi:PQQ-dependent sugar dehydrogenase [Saccharopolyspora mangrovi]|uniref:PQQ-dependent sugar dehydrogenase n=1 Tax=Saccharopolyspora mangrovi TaxID=3082379 RepID=A0ABU6A3V0_9PSEU|nr:PQQ-dependent sugar dehydrogenase [Saccharopolyspora sp. S2-29]MEB3366125.1 PQQ-dependent sugar dehydrogenase [Saccharopolyspora sp. S2-29]
MSGIRTAALVLSLVATGCATAPPSPATAAPPQLKVETVASGLEHAWDVGFLPDGSSLISQRPGRFTLVTGGQTREVQADLASVHAEGEGGLMGLLVHPDFANNRSFITCQTHQEGGSPVDVRLVTWRLAEDGSRADRVGDLLTGLPINSSGRHSGCRPELGADGSLLVSTGDTAQPAIAQDRTSLGGKILRMDVDTGDPLPDNPFIGSPDPRERLVFSFGHRNPQGVALNPDGRVFLAEHGPDVDDEVNVLRPGGNYGWDPSRGGTTDEYDESVPMTDLQRFPDAVPAAWSSGPSTEAVCAAEFLTGPQWGELDGTLAVPALKGSKLLLFSANPDGTLAPPTIPAELDDTRGRLRAARQGPDGALYVTTSNGTDDELLRITL